MANADRASEDRRWLDAAARLSERGVPKSFPNPSVGAIVVRGGMVVGRGWTQAGGRPHAEAAALEAAGEAACGATLYVTLEPCAHQSARGPACADLVAGSGIARVVIGCADPDPRTAGKGMERIRQAGIAVDLIDSPACTRSLAGYLVSKREHRCHVTLKVAMSQDGALARPEGESQWITGELSRRHVHANRARLDAILVGSGTFRIDKPQLTVRLPGLEGRSPQRWVMGSDPSLAPPGWHWAEGPDAVRGRISALYLMVEGGAKTARAFLKTNLVDRLMIYRAPFSIAGNVPRLEELTAAKLADSRQWRRVDQRPLGSDTLDVYEAIPCSPA
ncbi:MAG: bifunctional diaminohydroxyphosphoribosylaminopyrimidine deaminase/5-amino-6-(5-phosphoribosylamino)uracil reductase RibD [Novosphingobium sp.]